MDRLSGKVALITGCSPNIGGAAALGFAREINPGLGVFLTSAHTGEGLDRWFAFLREQVAQGGAR